MKKLYSRSTIYPSPLPPPPPQPPLFDHLSFLPATILTLVATLSPPDQELLTYLLSCSAATTTTTTNHHGKKTNHHKNHHPPCFTCYCFTCYTTYWARWDSSPNRQLIHEIIDAFEDGLTTQHNHHKKQGNTNKKDKRKNYYKGNNNNNNNSKNMESGLDPNCSSTKGLVGSTRANSDAEQTNPMVDEADEGEKQGSMRKIASFVWGSLWG